MIKTITARLYPTKSQIEMFEKCVRLRNLCYNYGIDFVENNYKETGKFTTFINILKKFKEDYGDYELVKECSSKIPSLVFRDLIQAYKNYFDGRKDKPKYKYEYSYKSFPHRNDFLSIRDKHLRLEKIGWVKMKDNKRLPRGTKYKDNIILHNCRILYDKSGKFWYASIGIDCDTKSNVKLNKNLILGIDIGIKDFAILSDGTIYPSINKTSKIKHIQKNIDKTTSEIRNKFKENNNFYSNNIKKLENLNRSRYYKIKCLRLNYVKEVVKEIINKKPIKIVIEDIDLTKMIKDSDYCKGHIYNQYLGFFRKYLGNKCEENGIKLIKADRNFPSTQKCSKCGNIKKGNEKLTLEDRIYKCNECGLEIDRDLNASINLKNYKE